MFLPYFPLTNLRLPNHPKHPKQHLGLWRMRNISWYIYTPFPHHFPYILSLLYTPFQGKEIEGLKSLNPWFFSISQAAVINLTKVMGKDYATRARQCGAVWLVPSVWLPRGKLQLYYVILYTHNFEGIAVWLPIFRHIQFGLSTDEDTK